MNYKPIHPKNSWLIYNIKVLINMDKDFFFKILLDAIESGNNISINRSDDKDDLFHFSSRFFSFNKEQNEILIDLPSSDNDGFLKKNDNIEIFFISQGLRLGFFSTVKRFSEFKLLSNEVVPAIVIEKPEEGQDLQRRRDFRIPTTPQLEVIVTYSDDKKTDQMDKAEEISVTCLCDDISRSGIALSENKQIKDKLRLEKGNHIIMDISIEGNSIQMEGSVECKRELYEGKKTIFGIDFFENKPNKFLYKKNLSIIMKYIMKKQREIIFKV